MNMGDAMMLGRGRCRKADAENHCGRKCNFCLAEHFRISWLSFALAPRNDSLPLISLFQCTPNSCGGLQNSFGGFGAKPLRAFAVNFWRYGSATADVRLPRQRYYPTCTKW